VAISGPQIERLKQQNVAVVLSPRSNLELYGATAPVAALKAAGVTLGLGTDWSPSGSISLLDEARCLSRYNRDNLNGLLSAADLHRMMTSDGAKAVGLQGHVGALAAGEWADVVIFDTAGRRNLSEILENSALPETLAVLIGGRAAMTPATWAGKLPQLENCSVDPRDLCGSQRLICGANSQRPVSKLLQQAVYTIDDGRLCRPQPTNDCVVR
jgi:cytosine/adenosine deaminase-related metal-dependent hydrolase